MPFDDILRYIFKEYKGPAATIPAGTIGSLFGGDDINISITGYKAIGAMIGFHIHPNAYTPKVMVTQNRLYRWYIRVQTQEYTITVSDWSAVVIYEKN